MLRIKTSSFSASFRLLTRIVLTRIVTRRPLNLQNTSLRPSANAFIPQAMKALSLVTDKLTDIALQFAPEDASPGTVRTAVVGSMLLVALSFVKGILSVSPCLCNPFYLKTL